MAVDYIQKEWFYIPGHKLWMREWLKKLVDETDLGLTQQGHPRRTTVSNVVFAIVESVLATRYPEIREMLAKQGEPIWPLHHFVAPEIDENYPNNGRPDDE